jgi:uncharacterized protein (TIGR02145 family)
MFEPEVEKGSITIQFTSMGEGEDMNEALTSVRCIVLRSNKKILNEIYDKTETPFQIELTDLKESKEYTIELYGRNAYGCITSQALEMGIEVKGNQVTTIQVEWEANIERGTVTDIDGNIYQTIKIGDQWWMAENLNVSHFRNGDPIPEVTSPVEWDSLDTGAWCAYNNDLSKTDTYGRLYNWFAVDDARGLAPEGWHIPTDEEWKQLELTLGMLPTSLDEWGYRGGSEGNKLKSIGTKNLGTGLWNEKNIGATNESCFSAVPAGWRIYTGAFNSIDYGTSFWTASEFGTVRAWSRSLSYRVSSILRSYGFKGRGFSIRCVMD